MLKNVANQTVNFQAILKANGDDAADLTLTAVVEVNVDKVGFAAGQGVFKFLDNGTHEYTPTQAETNGDYVVFRMRETTMITVMRDVYPIVQDDYKADVSGVATATELAKVPKRDDVDTYRTLRDGAGAIVQQIRERLHDSEQA